MKKLVGLVVLMFSINSFACSVATPMGADLLFLSGITNKLQNSPDFSQFSIKSISNIGFSHVVLLQHSENNKCVKVMMEAKVDSSCEVDAEIRGYQYSKCK